MVRRSVSFALGLVVSTAWLVTVGAGVAVAQKAEADVFVAKAVLAYEERRYEEALGLLREALEHDPQNVDALYYTGLVRITMGQVEEAIGVLEQARALDPKDEAILFQVGVAYFGLQKYDQAQPLLEQVFAAKPRVENLGYFVGFMRYRKKDYQGALRAFSAGTSTDPNVQQLTRFYTGLALAILGLSERAAAEVEAALRLQPASALTGPAERLRDAILAAPGKKRSFLYEKCVEAGLTVCDRFAAEVRVGVLYDTNVAVNPEPSHDPIAEILRRRPHKSPAELAGVRLDYAWLRTGPWEATASYSLFQVSNNELPKFNIQNHLGSVSGAYRDAVAGLPFQVGLQYAYDFLTLDNDEFLQRNTVTLFGTLVENSFNLTTLQGRVQTKEFSHDTNIPREEVRDAQNWMVGFAHVFRFEGDKHLLRVGYQFDVEDTRGRNFKYLGNRYQAGAQYTLPWGETRLKYDLDLHLRNYRHADTLLPVTAPGTRERRDRELVHVVRAEKPLPGSLTLSVEYQVTIARSNLAIFSFNRNVYSLILSWQY
jgi:tetratricopeptide (TPR) repeat protein